MPDLDNSTKLAIAQACGASGIRIPPQLFHRTTGLHLSAGNPNNSATGTPPAEARLFAPVSGLSTDPHDCGRRTLEKQLVLFRRDAQIFDRRVDSDRIAPEKRLKARGRIVGIKGEFSDAFAEGPKLFKAAASEMLQICPRHIERLRIGQIARGEVGFQIVVYKRLDRVVYSRDGRGRGRIFGQRCDRWRTGSWQSRILLLAAIIIVDRACIRRVHRPRCCRPFRSEAGLNPQVEVALRRDTPGTH